MDATQVRECSIARTIELIGEMWALLAIREMLLGNHRFADMVRRTGAPRDILTTRLRQLERDGLLERRQYSEHPPRYEYHLTPLGLSRRPVVTVLRQWGDEHLMPEGERPLRFTHSCGHELEAAVVCAACGGDAHENTTITVVDEDRASRA